MKRILVTGASGQVGSDLVAELRNRYGGENVLASDVREPGPGLADGGPFEFVDCTDHAAMDEVVVDFDADTIFHLAALLSAVAEEKPQVAWDINMGGLYRVLEVARENRSSVFFPSSIGAFGPTTPVRPGSTSSWPTMLGIPWMWTISWPNAAHAFKSARLAQYVADNSNDLTFHVEHGSS